jgi:hypothetical protein
MANNSEEGQGSQRAVMLMMMIMIHYINIIVYSVSLIPIGSETEIRDI